MSKTRIIALLLCLVMVAFSFAACGKKNNTASTTAKATTPATTTAAGTDATTAAATTTPVTAAPHVHTPEDHPTIDLQPTCVTEGEQSIYCSECGEKIEGTTEKIPVDPTAHKIDEWVTVEPTLLAPNGTKTGTCVLCDAEIVENLEWKPYVLASTMTLEERQAFNAENKVDWLDHHDLAGGIYIRKQINQVKDGDAHYYVTEENPLGNDLLVEVSYLWNDTMKTGYTGEPLTFANGDGFDVFHIKSNLDAKDNRKINNELCQYEYVYPTPAAIAENSALKKPALGDFGWHRLGFRVHQDAVIDNGAVKYTYVASAYVDGTLVLAFDLTDWVVRYFTSTVTGLLYTAAIDPEDDTKLICYDIGENPASAYNNSYGLFIVEEFFNSTASTAYMVLADLSVTCGQDFVQKVEANANPDDATFTLDDKGTTDTADDVTCPAKIWYKAIVE